MTYFTLCFLTFAATYLLNIGYITVLYHRGLTHNAVKLTGAGRSLLRHTGSWVTGIDPKGWACMHRLHHLHADTALDPHSPRHGGLFSLMFVQLQSYQRVLVRLLKKEEPESSLVKDIEFDVNWLNRRRLWILPYLIHASVGLWIALAWNAWLLGASYWLGMMSHPVQGCPATITWRPRRQLHLCIPTRLLIRL